MARRLKMKPKKETKRSITEEIVEMFPELLRQTSNARGLRSGANYMMHIFKTWRRQDLLSLRDILKIRKAKPLVEPVEDLCEVCAFNLAVNSKEYADLVKKYGVDRAWDMRGCGLGVYSRGKRKDIDCDEDELRLESLKAEDEEREEKIPVVHKVVKDCSRFLRGRFSEASLMKEIKNEE